MKEMVKIRFDVTKAQAGALVRFLEMLDAHDVLRISANEEDNENISLGFVEFEHALCKELIGSVK